MSRPGSEFKTQTYEAQSVKQQFAALRHLFDWLVTGHALHTNPASFVRGPKFSYTKGKTPILTPTEARKLIRSIPTDTLVGLRDRALIGLMIYTFARVSAAVTMNVKDVYRKQETLWVRLHEKGGKHHEMPCQHNLKGVAPGVHRRRRARRGPERAAIPDSGSQDQAARRQPPRPTMRLGHGQAPGEKAGIETTGICNHSFRGTGITAYLENPEANSSTLSRWPRIRTRRRRGSMIGAAIRCRLMRWSELGSERRLSGPFDAGLAWKTEKAGAGRPGIF